MPKILIIDDDESIRESTTDLLEVCGYEVDSAENGAAGIKKVGIFNPDLIVCDIAMPDLNGYAVLNELSKNEKTASIPFIFLTAKSEISDIRKGMQTGADDYIPKPFDPEELLKSIDLRLKKRNRLLTEAIKDVSFNEDNTKAKTLNKDSNIILMSNNEPVYINISDVVIIRSVYKYSKVTTSANKRILVKKLLKEWEEILPSDLFLRIHKSIIINMSYVIKFEKWFDSSYKVYLKNLDEPLVSSRRYSKKIRDMRIA